MTFVLVRSGRTNGGGNHASLTKPDGGGQFEASEVRARGCPGEGVQAKGVRLPNHPHAHLLSTPPLAPDTCYLYHSNVVKREI